MVMDQHLGSFTLVLLQFVSSKIILSVMTLHDPSFLLLSYTLSNFEGYSPLPLDDPSFKYDSPTIRSEIKFDLTSSTLGSYGYDVDSGSTSLVMFQCGFVDLNPNSLVGANIIYLYIQLGKFDCISTKKINETKFLMNTSV